MTSDQYKYLLMKRLQRSFSMKFTQDRIYTQNFFWKLFDSSVTVTESTYTEFVSIMDDQLAYLAEQKIYLCEKIPSKYVQEHGFLLVDAFAAIGITLVIDQDNNAAIFTKPNGEIMTYKVNATASKGSNYFYINGVASTEYLYAKASAPAYNFQGIEFPAEINPKIAGPGTYWAYNADTATMTISGSGTYAGAPTDAQLGAGEFTTVIIGANVSRLLDYCYVKAETTFVLLHPADAALIVDPKCLVEKGSCSDTYKTATVYTDCQAAIDLFSSAEYANYITLHSLSEWEG